MKLPDYKNYSNLSPRFFPTKFSIVAKRQCLYHYDRLLSILPFDMHFFHFQQNMWVRYGAIGFVAAVARTLNIADVHCNLLPLLQPFLKQPVVQVDKEVQM